MFKGFLVLLAIPLLLSLAACGGGDDNLKASVVDNYAAGAHSSYLKSLNSARALDAAIDSFLAAPSQARLDAAKHAWLRARDDYGVTEIYRFYEGPIDNEEDGPEGLINAWPLDEAYIDYVDGDSDAGIVNNPGDHPVIDAELLVSLNEEGGEENVSTGWHAIEFLLWGQDLNVDGPGYRPVEDYATNYQCRPRAAIPGGLRQTFCCRISRIWWMHGPPVETTTGQSSFQRTRTRPSRTSLPASER